MSYGVEREGNDATRLDEFHTAHARRSVDGVGARWTPPAVGRWLQIVMMPSFHADVVITVMDDGSSCRLLAQTAQCNLSIWDGYTKHQGQWPLDLVPPGPRPIRIEHVLTRRRARRLWMAAPSARPVAEIGGLDGICVIIRYRLEDELVEFHSWSPSRGASDRRLIDTVLESLEHTENEPLSAAINDCATYLD
jgi:hypothetical protein